MLWCSLVWECQLFQHANKPSTRRPDEESLLRQRANPFFQSLHMASVATPSHKPADNPTRRAHRHRLHLVIPSSPFWLLSLPMVTILDIDLRRAYLEERLETFDDVQAFVRDCRDNRVLPRKWWRADCLRVIGRCRDNKRFCPDTAPKTPSRLTYHNIVRLYIQAGAYYVAREDGQLVAHSDFNHAVNPELLVYPDVRAAHTVDETGPSLLELVESYDAARHSEKKQRALRPAPLPTLSKRNLDAPDSGPKPPAPVKRTKCVPDSESENDDERRQSDSRMLKLHDALGVRGIDMSRIDGFTAFTTTRAHGDFAGQLDTYFFDARGRKFRSANEVCTWLLQS